MSDEEIVDIDPEVLEEEGLFLEDDLEINVGLGEEEDLDFKLSPEEE